MLAAEPLAVLELAGGPLEITIIPTPIVGTGLIDVIAGDDYQASEERQWRFVDNTRTWPKLAGATVIFNARHPMGTTLTVTAEVKSTSPPEEVDVTFTSAQTETLLTGTYEYDLVARLADGHEVSLNRGTMKVARQTEGALP